MTHLKDNFLPLWIDGASQKGVYPASSRRLDGGVHREAGLDAFEKEMPSFSVICPRGVFRSRSQGARFFKVFLCFVLALGFCRFLSLRLSRSVLRHFFWLPPSVSWLLRRGRVLSRSSNWISLLLLSPSLPS